MANSILTQFFDNIWQDYVTLNPPARHIYELFMSAGEHVKNDHVAFRTFNLSPISLKTFSHVFTDLGYLEKEEYHFESKKLYAKHLEHPDEDMPLVFISELKVEEFDLKIRKIIQGLTNQIDPDYVLDSAFVYGGRPWKISYRDYLTLRDVSEYAAWMSAFGFRANHFTVSINHLKNFDGISEVNKFLKGKGIQLNTAGGEVKGSPAELLEQSSTLAYNKEVEFTEGSYAVPACYYEFAKRYKKPDGNVFKGFVTGSADKIFESTDKGQDLT